MFILIFFFLFVKISFAKAKLRWTFDGLMCLRFGHVKRCVDWDLPGGTTIVEMRGGSWMVRGWCVVLVITFTDRIYLWKIKNKQNDETINKQKNKKKQKNQQQQTKKKKTTKKANRFVLSIVENVQLGVIIDWIGCWTLVPCRKNDAFGQQTVLFIEAFDNVYSVLLSITNGLLCKRCLYFEWMSKWKWLNAGQWCNECVNVFTTKVARWSVREVAKQKDNCFLNKFSQVFSQTHATFRMSFRSLDFGRPAIARQLSKCHTCMTSSGVNVGVNHWWRKFPEWMSLMTQTKH